MRPKKIVEEIKENPIADLVKILSELTEEVVQMRNSLVILHDKYSTLEREVFKPKVSYQSIVKNEDFNGKPLELREESNIKMNEEDKLFSISNCIKILPPNLIVNGRHVKENVTAICGFLVSDEQLDEVYKNFNHDI